MSNHPLAFSFVVLSEFLLVPFEIFHFDYFPSFYHGISFIFVTSILFPSLSSAAIFFFFLEKNTVKELIIRCFDKTLIVYPTLT